MTQRYRNVVFTVNNYTDEDVNACRGCVDGDANYIVFGFEVGEEGTPHLQGYCQLKKQLRTKNICDMLGGRAHIEGARGNPEQARNYCCKDGEWEEYGTMKNPGKRTDLEVVKEVIAKGGRMRDVIAVASSYQGMRGGELILKYVKPKLEVAPKKVVWIYGGTGTGKSRKATTFLDPEDYWRARGTLQWFDGYDGEKTVWIDEFRADFCRLHNLLEYLDEWNVNVPVKGGFTLWNPELIVITTIYPPERIYKGSKCRGEDIRQLMRRISLILVPDERIAGSKYWSFRERVEGDLEKWIDDNEECKMQDDFDEDYGVDTRDRR